MQQNFNPGLELTGLSSGTWLSTFYRLSIKSFVRFNFNDSIWQFIWLVKSSCDIIGRLSFVSWRFGPMIKTGSVWMLVIRLFLSAFCHDNNNCLQISNFLFGKNMAQDEGRPLATSSLARPLRDLKSLRRLPRTREVDLWQVCILSYFCGIGGIL